MHPITRWLGAALVAAGLTLAGPIANQAAGDGGADDGTTAAAPKNPDYSLAVARIDANDYAGALALLRKVVAAEPDNADAHNYLGYSYRKLGKLSDSLASYQRALEIKPKHRGALEYLGELYLKTGDLAKAQVQLDKLDRACFFGCDEYRELKAKIAAFEKAGTDG